MLDRQQSLDRSLVRIAWVMLPVTVMLAALDQWPYLTERFSRGQVVGRDAYAFWAAARLALEGRLSEIYDHAAFQQAVAAMLGPGTGLHVFPYPPPALALLLPFGAMPYPLALALWSLAGPLAFVAAVAAPDFRRLPVMLALAAPLTLANVVLGQNGLFGAALTIGGLRLALHRPVVAGGLVGLLVFKPMLGLFLPLALLFDRRWTAFLTAGATVIGLCLLSLALFGEGLWLAYLHDGVPFQRDLLEHGTGIAQAMKLTGFMAARTLGYGVEASYAVQGVFSLAAAVLVAVGLWRRRGGRGFDGRDVLILALGTAAALPYLHFYDLATIAGGQILLATRRDGGRPAPAGARLQVLLWALPLAGMILNVNGIPVAAPLLLLALGSLALHRPPAA
ncbi:glycosyltransferase family 87 protein [Zavarzinia sp.]|uniref:glycosyltransferase family 87 protein n=1 Tax=Zavarzinia sp. TaxID=2027920 RepID=UPI0035669AD6